jgi:phage terminase large subunit-like protein
MGNEVDELAALVGQLEYSQKYHKLYHYVPYAYQTKFHHAHGKVEDKGRYAGRSSLAQQRFIVGSNKCGKTLSACMELAMHLTAIYPDWWMGHRFARPIKAMMASNTNETTRNNLQGEVFGPPEDDSLRGTGTVPIDRIQKFTRKPGIPNAFDNVRVKWGGIETGYREGSSSIDIKSYEQGFKKFMSAQWDVILLDEEPPMEIWSQVVRSTFARKHTLIMCTFTPEEGMTKLVSELYNDLKPGQFLIVPTWDDAPHMTPEVRANKLASIPAYERELRSKGTPISGLGLIYSTSDERLLCEPFPIPHHWPRITGIDFGWDHPFAAASLAWDRDSDTVYLVSEYRESRALPAVHAQTINAWGKWIPVAWPHDGLNTEKGTGDELIGQYRDCGVNTLGQKASNPPEPGKEEGTGGNSLEASVLELFTRMEGGRFKVFSTCKTFFEEKRMYHRKNGKIVAEFDDLLSAVRYAHMMLRHSRINDSFREAHYETKGNITYLSARPPRA